MVSAERSEAGAERAERDEPLKPQIDTGYGVSGGFQRLSKAFSFTYIRYNFPDSLTKALTASVWSLVRRQRSLEVFLSDYLLTRRFPPMFLGLHGTQ